MSSSTPAPGRRCRRCPGVEGTPFWTNRDAVQVTDAAGSLVVLGGGPIGCELAQVFARFGVRVTVVQHGDRLLPANEPEAAALVADVFAHEGIRVLTGVDATQVAYADGAFTLTLGDGEELVADKLLLAAGRKPNFQDLGLHTVGIDPGVRTLDVDDRMRVTGVDKLWAIGDVTGKGVFTHVSIYQDGGRPPRHPRRGRPAGGRTTPSRTPPSPTRRSARRRDDRGAGPPVGADRPDGQHEAGGVVPRIHPTVPAPAAWASRWSRTPIAACSWAPRWSARPAARSSASSRSRSTPPSRSRPWESMIYAYPTFHRAIESALADLLRLTACLPPPPGI